MVAIFGLGLSGWLGMAVVLAGVGRRRDGERMEVVWGWWCRPEGSLRAGVGPGIRRRDDAPDQWEGSGKNDGWPGWDAVAEWVVMKPWHSIASKAGGRRGGA
ncbi:hypothetical protein NL676_010881 [Syzygium grande]|nr:hypothetical protein NL676_010881 [Syzygium grande]